MKYGKKLLSAVLAIAVLSVAISFVRNKGAPVKPAAWIVDAAVALNRESIVSSTHGAARVSNDHRSAALQAAHEGEQLRVQRRFAEAEAAYRKAVEADPMDADSWADLADCAAAAACVGAPSGAVGTSTACTPSANTRAKSSATSRRTRCACT